VVGLDEAELAGGGGDTGLAAAIDGVQGGSSGGGADRDAQAPENIFIRLGVSSRTAAVACTFPDTTWI
jgi:hypothetical protein